MIISKPAIVYHSLEAFFSFLAMACFASIASFQAHFNVGPCKLVRTLPLCYLLLYAAGLTGLAIFITIIDLVLSLFIMAVPVIYEKYNYFIRLARAMKEDRVQFILLGTGAVTSLLLRLV
jgi:hypothetical protein